MSLVLKEITKGVGVLTLKHAAKRNALGAALIEELIAGLEELAGDGVRSVILRAAAGFEGMVGRSRRARIAPARPRPPALR